MVELPEEYRELQRIAGELGVPATGTAEELKARIIAANDPAREQYADQLREREYEVTGPHPVLDHAPGTTFRAVLSPEQEARLTRRCQIKPVEGEPESQEG